ncbi:MAG: hypothetical protein ACHQ1H_04275 [Nitrososphaerales archaeon]
MPTSTKYSQAQVDFASRLAKDTGADFYTIFGWELAEGGPSDNPLNIGPGFHYGTPTKAADVTASMIEKSNFYTDILKSFQSKYGSEDAAIAAQAKAIAYNEHWNVIKGTPAEIAAGRKQYLSNISGGALQSKFEGVQPNSTIDAGSNIQNPPDNPGGVIGGIASATDSIGSIAHDIALPFEWMHNNWQRFLFVLGGAIIIIIALVFVGLSVKSNVFSFKSGGE